MEELSDRRRIILDFVRDYGAEHGYPPTVRDIRDGCGMSSTSVVDHHLRVLERQAYLHRDGKTSRGLGLLHGQTGANTMLVPFLGVIAAGEPIPVPQADTWDGASGADSLELPTELLRGHSNVFALRVKGQSMIDAFINHGDIVIMQQAQSADDGDMVAVWLKREKTVTLKKLFRERGRIRLQPANEKMSPFYAAPDNVEVQGKVLAVIRTY